MVASICCGAQLFPGPVALRGGGAAASPSKRSSSSSPHCRVPGSRAARVARPLTLCLGTNDDDASSSSPSVAESPPPAPAPEEDETDDAMAMAMAMAGGGNTTSTSTSTASKSKKSKSTSKNKSTIDALSALLGDDADDEEQRREEEADRLRAERAAALEIAKAEKDERLKSFRAVSLASLRLQQVQTVFLDLPVFPKLVQGIFLDDKNAIMEGGGADKDASASSSATIDDLQDPDWFDVVLPSDGPGLRKIANKADTATASDDDADADADARRESLFFEDLIPEYTEYDGERLPGEFSIPIVPYPFVCHPGSHVRLNLFEPRWLTLFAKLMLDKKPVPTAASAAASAPTEAVDAASATATDADAASPSPPPPPNMPLVLLGARGEDRIDLIRNKFVQAYEAGDDENYDIIPGLGRMDETPFVGTGQFGALYRRPDGSVSGVGTAMKIEAHDVVVNGKLLAVYAIGKTRFRVLRVRQVNPYLVVDAVPLVDEDEDVEEARVGAGGASVEGGGVTVTEDGGFVSNVVGVNGSIDFGDSATTVTEGSTSSSSQSSQSDEASSRFGVGSAAAAQLAIVMERLIEADPYYSDAVGLGEAWTQTSLQKEVRGMNEFDVANAVLYGYPKTSLRLLASTNKKARMAATTDIVKGMEAAVAAGITPRKARLLRAASAFSSLFAIGFTFAYIRDVVEQVWGATGGGGG